MRCAINLHYLLTYLLSVLGSRLDLSGSRDIIDHVTLRLSIGHFLLLVRWNQLSISIVRSRERLGSKGSTNRKCPAMGDRRRHVIDPKGQTRGANRLRVKYLETRKQLEMLFSNDIVCCEWKYGQLS